MSKLTTIRKERVIDFPGDVLVKEGDKVEPEAVIVISVYNPRRPFFIDVAGALKVAPNEIKDWVVKKEGDDVEEGELLAKRRVYFTETVKISSPVEGTVERISSSSGYVIIREREAEIEPRKVNVAEELEIGANEVLRYMKKRVGESVEKGGVIAELPLMSGFMLRQCKSPIYGKIKTIDTKTGEVVLQRPHQKIELKAGLHGEVEEVIPEKGAVIKTRGYRIQGMIGFGKEAFGDIKCIEEVGKDYSLQGKIVVSKKRLSGEEIKALKDKGVKGIVFAELNVSDVEQIFGEEVYSGVTGRVDRGIVVVLLKGFGDKPMKEEDWDFFKSLEGMPAYLDGRTQIRTGVMRPEVIISRGEG